MESLWDDTAAASFDGDLGKRVYTSRLLGSDPSLVLHGGGNTSVKITERDLHGQAARAPLHQGKRVRPRDDHRARLRACPARRPARPLETRSLSDTEMARQMRVATIDPQSPAPSVEAILHAILPFRFVDHTHPDALISVMNTPSGRARVEELYGDSVVVVEYVMPGFALAKRCVEAWAEADGRAP